MERARLPTDVNYTVHKRKSKENDLHKHKLQDTLRQQRRINEKLRKELKTKRIRLSTAIGDIIKYCEKHKDHDPFVSGFKYKENPFKEKGGCIII